MLHRVYNSIRYRAQMARFGIYYLRSFSVTSIRIAGRRVRLSFPAADKPVLEWEMGHILFQDCYHLGRVPRPIRTVLDIGANVGLFGLAARHFFPGAVIHAYEPNPSLEPYLRQHCEQLSIRHYPEALGLQAGRVQLEFRDHSMQTVTRQIEEGGVPQIPFREALDRVSGQVDLVKLDCEGAEWSLFEDAEAWRRVGHLTMEYHLWAKPGATLDELRNRLDQLGFDCLHVEPASSGTAGLLQAANRRPGQDGQAMLRPFG